MSIRLYCRKSNSQVLVTVGVQNRGVCAQFTEAMTLKPLPYYDVTVNLQVSVHLPMFFQKNP